MSLEEFKKNVLTHEELKKFSDFQVQKIYEASMIFVNTAYKIWFENESKQTDNVKIDL
ncbi:MAG: hypothetical protein JWM20_836 [Patescibacteria group bacterium]|nr:hypothetical protein [Patescibacteria group bacterium]